jgi:hypothetical protein
VLVRLRPARGARRRGAAGPTCRGAAASPGRARGARGCTWHARSKPATLPATSRASRSAAEGSGCPPAASRPPTTAGPPAWPQGAHGRLDSGSSGKASLRSAGRRALAAARRPLHPAAMIPRTPHPA